MGKFFRIGLSACALLAACAPSMAAAASWAFVQTSDDRSDVLYVDTSSSHVVDGEKRTWWKLVSLPTDDSEGVYYSSLVAVKCTDRSYRTVSLIARDFSGKIHTIKQRHEWHYAAPDTMADNFVNFACTNKVPLDPVRSVETDWANRLSY